MDENRFDAITRALITTESRRTTLRTLLGTLLGGALLGPSLDARAAAGKGKGTGNGGGKKQSRHAGHGGRSMGRRKHPEQDRHEARTQDLLDEQTGALTAGPTPAPVDEPPATKRSKRDAEAQAESGEVRTSDVSTATCLPPGAKPCRKASDCCSGRCKKKKRKCLPCLTGTEYCPSQQACVTVGECPCPVGETVCAQGCKFTTVSEAVAATPNGGTIRVLPGTYDADLVISKDLTLTRCGDSGEVILRNATTDARAVAIRPGVTATLKNLTVSRQPAFDYGGGVLNQGVLSLDGCTLRGNASSPEFFLGAGLENRGDVKLRGCSISANRRAGIGNRGEASFTDCVIEDNDGFPLLNWEDANMTLTGCTVSDNRSPGGGGVHNNDGTLSIAQSTFTGNTGYQGGAVFSGGDLTITDSTFGANTATFEGGGIFAGGAVLLQRCEVRGNTARVRGGGLSTIGGTAALAGCAITGNVAGSYGGGVSVNAGGQLIMENCNILDNTTQQDSTNQEGGGLHLGPGDATLTGCTISRNRAHNRGGGIRSNGSLGLQDCTISDNDADEEGGGIYHAGGTINISAGDGTEIRNNRARSGAGIYTNQGTLSLTSCAIDGNAAAVVGGGIDAEAGTITFVAGGGSSVTNNTAGIRGGGILARTQATVTLNDNTISGNAPDNCSADSPIAGCSG